MFLAFILGISISLQFSAAFLSLRLIRVTGRRIAWILISVAVSLMAIRRCITLYGLISGNLVHYYDYGIFPELIALVTSVLMVAGIAWIDPLFRSIQNSRKEIRDQRNLFNTIFTAIPDFLILKNRELVYQTVNPAFCRFLGKQEEDINGKTDFDLFPHDEAEMYHSEENRIIVSGKPQTKEEEVVGIEGRKWIQITKTPISNTVGETTGILVSASDITERRKAEEMLLQYQRAVEDVMDLVCAVNKEYSYTLVNEAFLRFHGLKREYVIGHTISEVLGEKVFENIKEYSERCLQGEQIQFEMKYPDSGTDELFSKINFYPLRDENKKINGIVAIIKDITEHKRLEAKFTHAQRMESIGRLAGGIAHDFNNLLTVIIGNAEFVILSVPPKNQIYKDIEDIKKAAERAANLTRQLLAFSSRQIIEPCIIILNNMLLEMDKMLRRIIGENVELVTLLAEDLWTVKIDPGQIEQVLANLVVNAYDAMPDGGKLIIETANVTLYEEYTQNHPGSKPGDYVMLAVSDTGHGMDEEIKSHIFEPFFTTKEKDKGTGLGLATCYGIVKQNNGNIWVYSEPGHGTSFKIYLPRTIGKSISSFTDKKLSNFPKSTETVLFVEDEPAVRMTGVRILRNQGYNVYEANNGEEALRLVKKPGIKSIHLLITDVIMPRMGGKELMENLTEIYPDVKVLFVSGYTDNTIVNQGILHVGIAFLQKPYSPSGLVQKAREILDK